MANEPESEVDTSSEAVALIADARGLPNPERNLLSYNERELIRLVYRMADCMEALAKERDAAVREAEAAEEELAELRRVANRADALMALIDTMMEKDMPAAQRRGFQDLIRSTRNCLAALNTKGE